MKRNMTKNEEQFELDSEIEFCRFDENFLRLEYRENKYNFNMANVCDYLSRNPGITNLDIWDKSLDQKDIFSLANLRTLKELTLYKVNMSDEGMRLLALNSAITKFVFNCCEITDQQALHLATKTSPAELSIMEYEKLHISGTGLDALTNNKQLNTFNLDSWPVQEAVLKVLENKLSLTHLNLNKSCEIGYQKGILRNLRLNDNQIGDHGATVLKNNRTITNLSLRENGITEPGARALASSHVITHLNLANNQIGDTGATAFKSNHTIIDLNLSSCGISSLGAGELAGNKKITRLVLRGNNIGDQGAAAFYDHPFITELDLSNCGIGEQGALQLADTKTITRLNLEENKIGDRGAAAFKTNRSITDLNLTRCDIGSQGAIELSQNGAITFLRLSLNAIGDAGAAAFKANTFLTRLHMMDCKITCRGAIELAKNKIIKVLGLSGNGIGDAGAVAFIDNTSLTELSLCRTGISDRGLSALTLNQSIITLLVDEYSRRIMTSLAAYFLLANRTWRRVALPDLLFLSHFHQGLVNEIKKMPLRNRLFQQEYPAKVREEIIECLEIKVLTNLVWEYAEGEFPYQYGLLNKIPGGREAINHLCETVPGLRNRFDCQPAGVLAEGNSPYAMGDRKGENRDSPPSFRAIGFADAQDINRKPWTLYSAGMAGQPGKFEDWKPLDPVETEYFSEFAKKDNGTDMLGLRIRTIETVRYLLNYLNLNPAIKRLLAVIFCPFDEAVSLLAGNNTLTSLNLYGSANYDLPFFNAGLDKGLVALSSNQSLTHLTIETMSELIFSHERIIQLLKNNTVLKSLELNHAQIDNDMARTLFSHPNLEKLSFKYRTFTLDDHHLLNSHLQTLHLSGIKKQGIIASGFYQTTPV